MKHTAKGRALFHGSALAAALVALVVALAPASALAVTDGQDAVPAQDGAATVTIAPDPESGAYEPWAPGEDNALLPYTISDGVMTFDDVPELGEWYQLDLELAEGVTCGGTVGGGTSKTMTLDASCLDKSDPLYDPSGYEGGPFWIRGDHGDDRTSLIFYAPTDKALTYELVGAGTVRPSGGLGILLVTLDGPATLKVGLSDETVITDGEGVSLAHKVNVGEDGYGDDQTWSALTLMTDWVDSPDQMDFIISSLGNRFGLECGVTACEISLLDPMGNPFSIPEGETVTLTMPLPEGVDPSVMHVARVDDDGTMTEMDITVDASAHTASFETTSLSTFALVETKTSEPSEPVEPAEPTVLTSFSLVEDEITIKGMPGSTWGGKYPSATIEYSMNEGAQAEVTMEVIEESIADLVDVQIAGSVDYYTIWRVSPTNPRPGTAVIKATARDLNSDTVLTDTVTVNVTRGDGWADLTDVSDFFPDEITLDMGKGETYEIVNPEYMESALCVWHFEPGANVVINSLSEFVNPGEPYAEIAPVSPGTCEVTVVIEDEFTGREFRDTVKVTVIDSTGAGLITNEEGASVSHVVSEEWEGVSLVTEWLGGDVAQAAGDAVNAAIADVQKMYVYDIHLLSADGSVFEIPAGQHVTVTLPIPDGMEADGVRVFHVADDGSVTDMGATVDADARTVTFQTSHFSTFVIARIEVADVPEEETPTTPITPAGETEAGDAETGESGADDKDVVPATGDAGSAVALMAAISGSVALLGSAALRRRR